jgi:hypothetical protein
MAYAAFRRLPQPPRKLRKGKVGQKTFPAPTSGWMSATNLAEVDPGHAYLMENMFPTLTGVRPRSGSAKWATVDATLLLAVESLITYIGGVTRKVWAASNGKIFPITSPATPTTVDVTGQTSNYYSSCNFATAGGQYLFAVNGTDFAQRYDGAAWLQITAVSAGAITGIATNLLSHVWVYQSRLWFIEKNSQRAWFLPVNSISGAAQSVSLAGVFQKGGALQVAGIWSVNTGGGLYNMCVFISSEGEYAVYTGTDPTSAATWSLVGVYNGSPPLGKNQNGMMQAGGDLLILTQAGLVSMSDIQTKDPAALSISGVTKKISPDWILEQANRRGLPWEIIKWPSRNMALVTCPVVNANTPPIQFVVNLETGAWCKYTGWDTRCITVHNDLLLFGTNNGTIVLGETTGADQGAPYVSRLVSHMDHLDHIGDSKTTRQARAVFRTTAAFIPKISITADYVFTIPIAPNAAAPLASPGAWDAGIWDSATWDTSLAYYTVTSKWVSVEKQGFAHAFVLQITNGATIAPTAELSVYDITYELGVLVV